MAYEETKGHVGMTICFFCGEADKILLQTRYNMAPQLPKEAIYDMDPCPKCQGYMKQGIILLGCREDAMEKMERERKEHNETVERTHPSRRKNMRGYIPDTKYRTGEFLVVSEDWVRRTINPEELRDQVLKCRWSFVSSELAQILHAGHQALQAGGEAKVASEEE